MPIERCTFPQWDGADGTLNVAFPTENELNITTNKAYPRSEDGNLRPSCELEASNVAIKVQLRITHRCAVGISWQRRLSVDLMRLSSLKGVIEQIFW
jgi:hypothetical protein